MAHFSSFAELIEEKIRKEMRRSPVESPSINSEIKIKWGLDYENSPLLNLKIKESSWKPRAENTPYKVRAKTLPPYSLNDQQTEAVRFFETNGTRLLNRFSLQELKRAFRKVALKTHPDQGGTAKDFMALKIQFKILTDFLGALNK